MTFSQAGLLLALVLCPVTDVLAQTMAHIFVYRDRPLARAAAELSKQLGVPITFEEMEFEHPDDFQAIQSRGETVMIPRFGPFRFDYSTARPPFEIAIELLAAYHERFPGR